jgi:hypothetical protein
MTKSELEVFITLKFFPPRPTEAYADSIPNSIHRTFFFSSNLDKEKYTPKQAFMYLIAVYCTKETSPTIFLDEFWNVLKEELMIHYSIEDQCSLE